MRVSSSGLVCVVMGVLAFTGASVANAQNCAEPQPAWVLADYQAACMAAGFASIIVGADAVDDVLVGTGGDDCIIGLGGNDIVLPFAGADCIYAGAGDDTVLGSGGQDTAWGEAGTDILSGGDLADFLHGGDGDDILSGDGNDDQLFGAAGNDTINGGGGNDAISGGAGTDDLRGDAGNDMIDGGDANDTINGGEDVDVISGGDGDDTIDGGNGGDIINGGNGNDGLTGGPVTSTAVDTINGDDGDDTIDGGPAGDFLSGGLGDDVILGGTGDDTINGGDGSDELRGQGGSDTINGGDGTDYIFGDAGDDMLFGDAGNDLLFGGPGADSLSGGDGNDTLHGDDENDTLSGDAGRDNLYGGDATDSHDGGTEDDYCRGGTENPDGMGGSGATPAAPGVETFTNCEALLTYAALGTVDAVTVGGRPTLRFTTTSEAGTQGFEIFRRDGDALVAVGPALVPALMGAPQGGTYYVADRALRAGATYDFVEVEVNGQRNTLGTHTVALTGSADVTLTNGLAAVAHPLVSTPVAAPKAGDAPDGPAVALYLGVGESGIYRVTMTQVAAALELSLADAQARLASHGLAVTVAGQPVAWWSDLSTDALFFYGESRDSMYLADNLYRLTLGSGENVTSRNAGVISGGEGATSEAFVRAELDVSPVPVMNPDANQDFWFWQYVGPGRNTDFPITLPAPSGTGSVQLAIELHGATTRVGAAGEHSANVLVNGTVVGSFAFEGMVPRVITLDVPATVLVDGDNTVRLSGNGAAHSVIWVDAVSARYTRTLADVGTQVGFAAESHGAILVEGLSTDDVQVLDISNPRSPALLQGIDVLNEGGAFSVRLGGDAGGRYVAVTSEGIRTPRLSIDYASDLRHLDGAEYVIIAPRALFSGAGALAEYRAAQGLSSVLVDLNDVYDEFTHGTPDPHAIRAFLEHGSEHWATPPRYVVLAGAGTYDYLNIRGLNGNLLPALMVNTNSGLFASDTAFADFNDDGRPELLVGRLPVSNNDALDAFVARLTTYEAGLADQTDRTLFIADASHSAFNANTDVLTTLVNALSDAGMVEQLYRSNLTLDLARTRLFAALGEGVFWVNYTGHGALNAMTSDGLLTATDVPTLTTAELAIFTTMTCTTSRFEVPGYDSFGETLSNSNAAIGVWGASGLSDEAHAQQMVEGFTRGVYGDSRTLGEAIDGAYGALPVDDSATTRDMLAIYNLLGDPATHLKDRGPADIIIPVEDMGTSRPIPVGDAGMTGDAGTTVDLGNGEPTPPSGGGNAGCSAGPQTSSGAALFGLVFALVGLRVRRRQR